MAILVKTLNPLIARIRTHLDVTRDASGRFSLTVNQGGEFTATLLAKAIDALPQGSPFTLDTTATGALEESVIGVILSRQNGQERTLCTSNEGLAKLITMRLVTKGAEGSPSFVTSCSWQLKNSSPGHTISGYPAMDVLGALANYVQELEKPIERPSLRAPNLETLITVDDQGDTVRVTVTAPIRGEYVQLLQDYLSNLDTRKKVVVDYGGTLECPPQGGYCVLMAARRRKNQGAPALEIKNVPESLTHVFNPSHALTIGFILATS
jgi:hypothetical protein